ncbi:hypothetical protein FPSE_03413 [Fusarium pseudograminearum CS3096]|uniref:40S ribosomal protein S22 n=1 Tax=Fusarium pseudograminearum (strain CS3096) TaxID=1028729 RepID=K3VNI3_FUSPC|nr:hypothetical protein FPSE_03413 [Fusarium pseudograminearum CS3096]EKJ76414.1 hypothetical protein FPSE_03413 [Fusarium pseudograminearum CS3096]
MALPSSAGTFRLDFIVAEEPAGHDNTSTTSNFASQRELYNQPPSVLSDALKNINNAEKAGKRQVLLRPSSKVVVKFLELMQAQGYIGEFEELSDNRSGKIVVQLNGRLNKCGVISPRFNVRLGELEKWVVRLLPARQFGHIVLTTSSGIMVHESARRKHVSGKIIGFFY